MTKFEETLKAFEHCVTLRCYACPRLADERNSVRCLQNTLREVLDIINKNKEVLQKQTPMEVHVSHVIEVGDAYRFSICPTCLGTNITESDMRPKVCTWCGQRFSI